MILTAFNNRVKLWIRPVPHHAFMFELPSVRYGRIYIFVERWMIAATNNYFGQLRNYLWISLSWKYGWRPRFRWSSEVYAQ